MRFAGFVPTEAACNLDFNPLSLIFFDDMYSLCSDRHMVVSAEKIALPARFLLAC